MATNPARCKVTDHPLTVQAGPNRSRPHINKRGICDCDCPTCCREDPDDVVCVCPDCDTNECGLHENPSPTTKEAS